MAELFYWFEWGPTGKGKRLGETFAESRAHAWEKARREHGVNVHVQSKRDYDAEQRALTPRPAA